LCSQLHTRLQKTKPAWSFREGKLAVVRVCDLVFALLCRAVEVASLIACTQMAIWTEVPGIKAKQEMTTTKLEVKYFYACSAHRNQAMDLACFILHAVYTVSVVSNRVPCLLEYCNANWFTMWSVSTINSLFFSIVVID
jgi:hypothetical protein